MDGNLDDSRLTSPKLVITYQKQKKKDKTHKTWKQHSEFYQIHPKQI